MVVDAPLAILLDKIESIEVSSYSFEEDYDNICNILNKYMNESQDWQFEDVMRAEDEGIISYDEAEDYAKDILANDGLVRLYYFLGNCNFDADSIFYLNGYGNLQPVDPEDVIAFKQDIVDAIEDAMSDEYEG